MNEPDHPTTTLDDTVHQRARLGVMAILNEVKRADFATIRATLELTPGNLSQHLSVLENAGLAKVEKTFVGKRVRTWVRITPAGRRAFRAEIEALQALIDLAGGARD